MASSSEAPISWPMYPYRKISQRARSLIVILGLLTFGSLLIWGLPHALAIYYQLAGAQELDQAVRSSPEIQQDDILCAVDAISGDGVEKALRAQALLESAILHNPRLSQAHLLAARTACLAGDYEKADTHYQRFIELREDNPLGYLELGFVYEALGNQEAAIDAWQKAGISIADLIGIGRENLESGNLDRASYWFLVASRMDPENPDPWKGLGDAAFARYELAESLEHYQRAWELDVERFTSAYVTALLRAGRNREAIRVLEKTLSENPAARDRLQWWQFLGDTYALIDEWDRSSRALKSAIADFPAAVDLYVSLGWAEFRSTGDAQPAIEYMLRAIEMDENPEEVYFAIGEILFEDRQYAEATGWLDKAIQRNPTNLVWRLSRANATRSTGNFSQAIREYLQLLQMDPGFDPALYELAWAYHLSGQEIEARETIEGAIRRSPSPKSWYLVRAGLLYESSGNLVAAKEAYLEALAIDPADEAAQARLEFLNH